MQTLCLSIHACVCVCVGICVCVCVCLYVACVRRCICAYVSQMGVLLAPQPASVKDEFPMNCQGSIHRHMCVSSRRSISIGSTYNQLL